MFLPKDWIKSLSLSLSRFSVDCSSTESNYAVNDLLGDEDALAVAEEAVERPQRPRQESGRPRRPDQERPEQPSRARRPEQRPERRPEQRRPSRPEEQPEARPKQAKEERTRPREQV